MTQQRPQRALGTDLDNVPGLHLYLSQKVVVALVVEVKDRQNHPVRRCRTIRHEGVKPTSSVPLWVEKRQGWPSFVKY